MSNTVRQSRDMKKSPLKKYRLLDSFINIKKSNHTLCNLIKSQKMKVLYNIDGKNKHVNYFKSDSLWNLCIA